MQLGIFAKTFAGENPLSVLQAAKAAGYETVQFNFACCGLPSMPDDIAPEILASIARARQQTDVGIAAISATYNMIHPDPAVRAAGLRRLGLIIAVAKSMGTSLVTLCTGTRDAEDQWRHHPDNNTPEAWRDLTTETAKALQIAEHHGVTLGIEPELANVVSSATHAKKLLDDMQSPNLRIILDPANLFETASSSERERLIAEAVELLGPHIAMAHAKDRNATGEFVAAGRGVIDFSHFVGQLRQASFAGPLVTHGLAENEASEVSQFLRGVLAA
jgi:sugar phosphate isomerase/epimerase